MDMGYVLSLIVVTAFVLFLGVVLGAAAASSGKKADDKIKTAKGEERQSNLVDHARRELDLLGEEPDIVDQYLKIVRIFADGGHSGGSAAVFTHMLNRLMQFENLTPLTDDPDEWIQHDESVWGAPGGIYQNKRNSEAFSTDGGKTYYLLSERDNGEDKITHISEHRPEALRGIKK